MFIAPCRTAHLRTNCKPVISHYRRYGNPVATAAKYDIGIRELKARAKREAWS